ncbi:MAG: hypothetical protein LBQ58_09990 [Synergistaceae bacterium]|jgi:hypothetical protein|nr:hypothetical protein [Synergistaceae bacterium]
MEKLQMLLQGVASVFDLDAIYAKERRYRAMCRLIDTETDKVRISQEASPSGAFRAVGNNLRHAIEQYDQKSS